MRAFSDAQSWAHRGFSAMLALTLATGPALATTRTASHPTMTCAMTTEQDALQIKKISSELMVASETCHSTDRYNAYMTHYQGALAGNEKVLNGYFKRLYGRNYQKTYDDFTTELANVQMQQGLQSGTAFCGLVSEVFDEVMVLDGPDDLAAYARSKPVAMPLHTVACTTPAPVAPKATRHRTVRHKTTQS